MRDLFDDKLERAINILKAYQPRDRPYYGCFSGGKDSIVIKEIGRLAGIDVAWHYNATTIDPPELVRFIKREHGDVIFNVPERNFFEVAKDRGFPTRRARWCCQEFKESRSPSGSTLILGGEGGRVSPPAQGVEGSHRPYQNSTVCHIPHHRLERRRGLVVH